MRKCVLAANWKMNHTSRDVRRYVDRFLKGLRLDDRAEAILFVPFPYLKLVADLLQGAKNVGVGAQNLHWEPSGAYTGEVSAEMITDSGARYVLVGHSERRKYFGEDDQAVNRKLRRSIDASLRPVLCLGETWEERQGGLTEKVTTRSLQVGLQGIRAEDLSTVYVAYEPVWAIGTGRHATPEQAEEVHTRLRGVIASGFGRAQAEAIPILYGGSTNPENTPELMRAPDIDGLLVGGASLDPEKFRKMIESGIEACGC